MRAVWLVARREYRVNLRSRSFLFATFGVPLLIILIATVVLNSVAGSFSGAEQISATAFVDLAGLITQDRPFRRLATEQEARAAREAGEIDAWFLVGADYMATGRITLHSREAARDGLGDAIRDFLRANLAAGAAGGFPPERLAHPLQLVFRVPGRELAGEDLAGAFMLPVAFALAFFTSLQMTSGYLMSSIVEERGGRVLEILLSSITPLQLLAGKLIGLASLGLTQLAIWLGSALALPALWPQMPLIGGLELPPDLLAFSLLYFLSGYFLFASIIVGIGALGNNEQESRQLAGILTMVSVIPFIAYPGFLFEPEGVLPRALTLIPLTAPLAAVIRLGMGTLSPALMLSSLALLLLSLALLVPGAARLFRLSLLLTGGRPAPRVLWRMLRGPASGGS